MSGVSSLEQQKALEKQITSAMKKLVNQISGQMENSMRTMATQLGQNIQEAIKVDPQAFVIGGGVSGAGSILTDTIQKYYRKSAFHASEETKFVLATLGNDAGIYGAVRQVLGQGGST